MPARRAAKHLAHFPHKWPPCSQDAVPVNIPNLDEKTGRRGMPVPSTAVPCRERRPRHLEVVDSIAGQGTGLGHGSDPWWRRMGEAAISISRSPFLSP